MNNPFRPGSTWYPFRWFLVIIAVVTMAMSFTDYTGWRLANFGGNGFFGWGGNRYGGGYYGSPMYHK